MIQIIYNYTNLYINIDIISSLFFMFIIQFNESPLLFDYYSYI